MANTKQAKKRDRQNIKRRANTKWQVSRMRTAVKKVYACIEAKDHALAMESYKNASSLIDRAQIKGKIHKNTAARMKSRLNAQVKLIASAA